MPKLNGRIPTYRLHRKSGQAIVTLGGKDHYLGLFGTAISRAEYDRLVTEWLAAGRPSSPSPTASALSINHLIHAYWEHALVHYRKPDGSEAGELHNIRDALRPLRRLYGHTSATEFGPLALKALREQVITRGWCRNHINRQMARIKSVFRWGVETELIPAAVHQSLLAVRGLQRGRSSAPESAPVRPVPEERIAAIQPFVSRQVWALIQLQLLCGARAGELVGLRGVDLNTGGEIWTAEPEEHKTAHHGLKKKIYFGPQARAILQQFLDGRAVDAPLFSPAEAERERREELSRSRRTPLSCGNRPGSNRATAPARKPSDHYTVATYRRAIERGCDLAHPTPPQLARQRIKGAKAKALRWETSAEWKARLGPERWTDLLAWRAAHRWHPHQLRHNAATQIRKAYGIEVARVILGHRSASVTEIYAELDDERAQAIMRRIG